MSQLWCRSIGLWCFGYKPVASPKPSIRRDRLLQVSIGLGVAELMINIGILEAINVDDAFIFQSKGRSPELVIKLSDYVVHSLAKLSSEQVVCRRPPPLP